MITNEIVDYAAEEFGGESEPLTVHGQVINFNDLDNVPTDDSILIQPANDVRLRIVNAKVKSMSEDKLKKFDIQFSIVDGIDENGKYKNARFWQNGAFFDNFFFYADESHYTSDYWQERKYLSNLKSLMKATDTLEIDPDNLAGTIIGKELVATIAQHENQRKNEAGDYEADGTFSNCARYLKKVS